MVGLRYTRAKRRNRFISFISLISMVGIALGVTVLIVVLSVMNGFQTEVRTRILGVASHLLLTAPQGVVTPAGVVPRLKQFTVVGTFDVGFNEADSGLALIHLDDAQKLYQMASQVSGVRLKLQDLFQARSVGYEITAKMPELIAWDWSRSHPNLFRAVQIEKRMMFIILTLIIAV